VTFIRGARRRRRHAGAIVEKPARFNDRWMLDLRGDDMIALVAKREEHALEGKVICLATTARENDLVVAATEQSGHLAARRLEGAPCHGRRPMPARWIAVMILKKWAHHRGDRGIDGRACVVVEINRAHGQNIGNDRLLLAGAHSTRVKTNDGANIFRMPPFPGEATALVGASAVAERVRRKNYRCRSSRDYRQFL